jgi:glucose-6-phosphate 1-dehydrogenase
MYDCMLGDATLFQRSAMVEAAWNVVGPIQNVWGALEPREFPNYPAGSWGPEEANELLNKDGRHWYNSPVARARVDSKTVGA